ncbi:MAG: TolC family protein [Proteobacteria bacterium]|nr:TolC family protein [Pseudomonadota bacterium]
MKTLIAIGLILLTSNIVVAATTGNQTITLDQAIIKVLEHHPQLKIDAYEARALAARIKLASLKPADSIKVEVEDFAGTGEASSFRGMQTTLSLARVLELGNKSTYRSNVVKQESYVLGELQNAERLDLLAETARRFLQVVINQEKVKLANEALVIANNTKDIVEKKISAAISPTVERYRVDIDIANLQLALEHAEHELESSRVMLSSMWNDISPDFDSASAELFRLDEILTIDAYAQLLERNPDLVRYTTQQRLADARLQLARIKQKPDIELSGGIRYLNSSDDVGFILSANIPFGTVERAVPVIEEAEMLNMIDPMAFEQKKTELFSTLFEIYQELLHSKTATKLLEENIIPSAQQALQDYEKLYSTGRYSLLELVEAQRTLLNSRSRLLESVANFHRYLIEIDRLTGALITTGVTQ